MQKPAVVKRLFWDIETSPNIVLSWRVGRKVNIDSDNILKERAIICIGYKWQHERRPHVLVWDKNQNDRDMLRKFLKVANEADEMVAHNGDGFDMPWFLTRCMFHGIDTFPAYKTADTLQWARRRLYFNSNRLNYLGKYLGLGEKLHTEFGLWKAICLDSCPKSLARMSRYCAQDVALLERVWGRLSKTAPVKTHSAVLSGGAKWQCPACASEDVHKNKTRVTAAGTKQHQMQCNDCGRYYHVSHPAFEDYIEAKRKEKE